MKIKFNYAYFLFFFAALIFFHLKHLFLIEYGTAEEHLLFSIGIIVQTFLETLVLTFFASLPLPRQVSQCFMVVTFFFLLLHIIEVPLLRLMDLTVWFSLDFLFDETWDNFLEMLYASNISIKFWLLAAFGFLALLFTGIWICSLFDKLKHQTPFFFSLKAYGFSFAAGSLVFLGWDAYIEKTISLSIIERFQKTLPLKSTFCSPSYPLIKLPGYLKPYPSKQEVLDQFSQSNFAAKHKPDIFLFVIESLREDFLEANIAPHLYAFQQKQSGPNLSFANANATQLSWYSIFNARYPFYWGEAQKGAPECKSLPLQIFKKLGYQTHVYSSSRLSFYQMHQFLFGQKTHLASSLREFQSSEKKATWECDQELIESLNTHLITSEEQGGRLFIIFIESTHFDYSWPETETHFKPITKKIDYLKTSFFAPHIEPIKNRYRNAIHFIDRLFGQFEQTLKETHNQEAVVVVTGDHGEEFFEEGHLFHASNINEIQTRVPIYYNLKGLDKRIHSHIDIFPTLLHHVTGDNHFDTFFDGSSLLAPKNSPFVVAGRYNASRNPSEFFIHTGNAKMRARFLKPQAIFQCNQLQTLSIEDHEETFHPIIHNLFNH